MSYYVYDSRGYVAGVASNGGLADFRAAVEAQTPGAESSNLIDTGTSEKPAELANELADAHFQNPSADSVCQSIAMAAQKCQDVVILTDGVGVEETI